MSLTPKVRRILVPPVSIPSKTNPSAAAQLAAVTNLSTAFGAAAATGQATKRDSSILQRHVIQHPAQPLVAFVLESTATISPNKVICVQHVTTSEVKFSMHWFDIAAHVYGETDAKKLPAAAKSLGAILSLQFYDPATLYWSRIRNRSDGDDNTASQDNSSPYGRWQSLAVQTTKRVLLLNLRQGPSSCQVLHTIPSTTPKSSSYGVISAHVCEKTVSAVPSSNLLALTDRWLLCGCVDGSMKCFDWTAGAVVKKIKGLGKGDCVVQLLSANPYSAEATTPKRILTVTKKGTVYLIELEFSNGTVEIQPPTARFQVEQQPPANPADVPYMQHANFSYDAHQDRFQWLVHTGASQKEPVLYVWNLKSLVGGGGKNLMKPEPTLIVRFPAVATPSTGIAGPLLNTLTSPQKEDNQSAVGGNITNISANAMTVLSLMSCHAAFSEDTVVALTCTDTGEVSLHGAVAVATNTTSTVQATPVMGLHLKQAILQAVESLEEDEPAELLVHAVTCGALGTTGTELTVATNWGLVVLELPVYSSFAVQAKSVVTASRYLHFGAGLGSLGKSVVYSHHSQIRYGSLDVLTANPVGLLEPKNPVTIYESPLAHHMPPEFCKRPFRFAPSMLQSPSGTFICLFWPCEFRYEILHTASLLQHVGQLRAGNTTAQRRNAVVATGTGVCDFGWLSDNDVFAVLHATDLQEQAALQVPKRSEESGNFNVMSPNLKMIGAGAMGVANLATTVTKTATNATFQTAKLATSAAVNTTMTVTKGATNAANMTVGVTTKALRSGAKGVTKGVKKSFGIFGGKKKKNDNEGSIITADDDDDDDEDASASVNATFSIPTSAELEASMRSQTGAGNPQVRQRYVELRVLEAIESQSAELSGFPAATCSSLGELSLRGGKRNPPSVIFGGPVLCVASRSEEDKEGHAHFYTSKREESGNQSAASSYSSSGPTLPYPDLVTWDDDGCLCAIVVENRVAVYLSSEPEFVLLGTVRIGSPSVPTTDVTSVKFVHGALYCCTWNSVHCVLLGDLAGGICRLDTYLLASTDVPMMAESSVGENNTSFVPVTLPLPLVQPSVLGYQGGSLILSTLRGVHAIPLSCPLMRIGLFLADGQTERAAKWFDAVQNSDHEALGAFLERRGHPEMCLQLQGLSLETIVDISMRHGYVDRLEDVVETFGVGGLRAIDMGRGVSKSIFGQELVVHSIVVCVGAYLLAHGRVELTRRLATECLRSGGQGKKDAFFLATLLLPVDESDATRLIQRAVAEDGTGTDDWMIGDFVRNYVLPSTANGTM